MTSEVATPTSRIYNEDCVSGMDARLAPGSVDLCVTSIPFEALFMYSGKAEDIGNNPSTVDIRAGEFALQMRFCIEQLARVMAPGAVAAIHIQQLIAYKVQHGFMGRRDFRGAVVDLFTSQGLFEWTGEIAIPKDPQRIAQIQKLHSLLFVTGQRDARALAPAVCDYVMLFRRPGEGRPVASLYHPERNPGGWVTTEQWIAWARGVWDDIRETDVLEAYKEGREADDEKHVCPLQLEVIRRCVRLYSAPGDLVLDPFMGVGSVAHVAITEGRSAVGFELKASYHRLAVRAAKRALEATSAPITALDLWSLLLPEPEVVDV